MHLVRKIFFLWKCNTSTCYVFFLILHCISQLFFYRFLGVLDVSLKSMVVAAGLTRVSTFVS